MKITPRWTDWCVSFFVLGFVGLASIAFSAETDSYAWQPDGLKKVYGSENGQHWADVSAVEFGPDGKWIVSGGADSNLFVWETETLKPIAFAHVLPNGVKSVSVHPGGKSIAVGLSGQVWIYGFDGLKLTELHRLTGFPGWIRVRYTRDGSRLIVVTEPLTYLFDVTGRHPVEKQVLDAGGSSFDVSYDGSLLALCGYGGLTVWDISAPRPRKIGENEDSFLDVALHPDGRSLTTASSSTDFTLALWQLESDGLKKKTDWESAKRHRHVQMAIQFSPDGKSLIVAGQYGPEIQVWDLKKIPDKVRTLRCHDYLTTGLAFSADGRRLAFGDRSSVCVWEMDDKPVEPATSPPSQINDVWYGDDARLFAVTHERVFLQNIEGAVYESVPIDLATGKSLKPWKHEPVEGAVGNQYDRELALNSPDGNRKAVLLRVAVVQQEQEQEKNPWLPGYIRIYSLFQSNEDRFPRSIVLKGSFSSMAWSPDGKQLATSSQGKLQRWDSLTGELLGETVVSDGQCKSLRFTNGRVFAVQQKRTELVDYDKYLTVWDTRDEGAGAQKVFPILDRSEIDQAYISPKGNFLALHQYWRPYPYLSKPASVYHFDEERLRKTFDLQVDPRAVVVIDEFSPNGELLAFHTVGALNDAVGLLDARNGEKVVEWKPPGDVIVAKFSPDGRELALANSNNTVYTMHVPPIPKVAIPARQVETELSKKVPFQPPVDDESLRSRFEQLHKESQAANKKWRSTPGKNEPPFVYFAERFWELGTSAPETASGRDALTEVCRASQIVGYAAQNKRVKKLQASASSLLVQYHLLDPAILPVIEPMAYGSKDVPDITRRLIRESTDRRVQARASLVLARNFDNQRYRTGAPSQEDTVVIGLYQRIIDNYDGMCLWDGGPTYRSVAEKSIKRLKTNGF